MAPKCPNCNLSFFEHEHGLASAAHIESGCVYGALVGVVIERESCPIPSSEAISKINIDWVWDRLGPFIDHLEEDLVELDEKGENK